MKIEAYDLSSVVGYCFGISGQIPSSGSRRVRKAPEPHEIGAGRLGERLFARWSDPSKRPDIVVVERMREIAAAMSPDVIDSTGKMRFSGNADALKSQVLLHGALQAVAGIFKIPVFDPTAATVRIYLCGQSSATKVKRGVKRTAKEKAAARNQTKQMVIDRLVLLGYLPPGCDDDNRADATAVWFWADGNLARTIPKELVLV